MPFTLIGRTSSSWRSGGSTVNPTQNVTPENFSSGKRYSSRSSHIGTTNKSPRADPNKPSSVQLDEHKANSVNFTESCLDQAQFNRRDRKARDIDLKFAEMQAHADVPFRSSLQFPLTPPLDFQGMLHPESIPALRETSPRSRIASTRRLDDAHHRVDTGLLARRQNADPQNHGRAPAGKMVNSSNGSGSMQDKSRWRASLSMLTKRTSRSLLGKDEASFAPGPVMNMRDDFDPRIRGHILHDFSASNSKITLPGDSTYKARPNGRSCTMPMASNVKLETNANVHSSINSPGSREEGPKDEQAKVLNPTVTQIGHDSSSSELKIIDYAQSMAATPHIPDSLDTGPEHDQPINTSRFSFDFGNKGSALQEMIMEEKHREKVTLKQQDSRMNEEDVSEQSQQDYDEYDSDDEDFPEERIPGINCDQEVDQHDDLERMPHDEFGLRSNHVEPIIQENPGPDVLVTLQPTSTTHEHRIELQNVQVQDELYFDDGLGDELGDFESNDFDESIFDEQEKGWFGNDIRQKDSTLVIDSGAEGQNYHEHEVGDRTDITYDAVPNGTLNRSHGMPKEPEPNLDLGKALDQAFKAGAFKNSLIEGSNAQDSEDVVEEGVGDSMRGADGDMDEGAYSLKNENLDAHDIDDEIVAAANAEALENDDEGTYGQEFGFYAKRPDSSKSEFTSGGYFASRDLPGEHQLHSGNTDFQEPSLTPITELSERSARNSGSFIGTRNHIKALASPPIDDTSMEDLGAQMEILRRLRHGAFGGSTPNLGTRKGSPACQEVFVSHMKSGSFDHEVADRPEKGCIDERAFKGQTQHDNAHIELLESSGDGSSSGPSLSRMLPFQKSGQTLHKRSQTVSPIVER